jgi:hypothetical protein
VNLGVFIVKQVIIHEIPQVRRSEKDQHAPTLSEVPSSLDDRRRNFFRERITKSLGSRGITVIHDPDVISPVPDLVVDFFKGSGHSFVDISQKMATHLYDVQGGNSSPGMLAVIDGTIGTGANVGRCLSVLKLEMDAALKLQQTTIKGKATFDVEVQEVTLNAGATVFKASIFERAATLPALRGLVSDNQADENNFGHEVATFFLSRFLGCQPLPGADRMTAEFYERSKQFFNEGVSDGARKLDYMNALTAELQSNRTLIRPQRFASDYLDVTDQDAFVALFKEADGSVATIPKDDRIVAPLLREQLIRFQEDLELRGSPDAIRAHVDVDKDSTTIRSPIVGVDGRRR